MSRSATLFFDGHNDCNEYTHGSENYTLVEQRPNIMQDGKLRNILDPCEGNKNKRRKFDEEAVIATVQQNPNAAKKEYTFENQLYRQTCYPLHASIILGWSLNVIKILYNAFPQAIEKKCHIYNLNQTPLHLACAFRTSSPDIVSFLLQKHPSAIYESDHNPPNNHDGLLPLHTACLNRASTSILSLLIHQNPMAARTKTTFGKSTPLHIACAESLPYSSLSLLLKEWPDAAKEKTNRGQLPLHHAVYNCTIDKIQLLVETYPHATLGKDWEGRTPLDCNFIPKETLELLQCVQYLLSPDASKKEEERIKVANEIFTTFVEKMKWWGGAAIVLNAYPMVKLSLFNDCVKIAPYILSFVGRRCRLLTMQKLICNRQDLVVGGI